MKTSNVRGSANSAVPSQTQISRKMKMKTRSQMMRKLKTRVKPSHHPKSLLGLTMERRMLGLVVEMMTRASRKPVG